MRIVDEQMLQRFRTAPRCEICRKVKLIEPHHIHTRGAGRLDISCNLISLCRECHSCIDNAHGKAMCLAYVAKREGHAIVDVEGVIHWFRSLPKGLDREAITRRAFNYFDPLAFSLALKAIEAMPDQSPVASPIRKRKRRPSPIRERAKAARAAAYQRAKARKKAKA